MVTHVQRTNKSWIPSLGIQIYGITLALELQVVFGRTIQRIGTPGGMKHILSRLMGPLRRLYGSLS
jgi:hypothetical protein